jgi:acyl-CoA thioester hydrolase
MYTKKLYAGWADMDFNAHMKNTAYLDKAADVRQKFLMEHGFPVEEFLRQRIGPVVMKDELELRHEIFREDGKLAARVSSAGGWLDLAARKLIAPPPALLAAMNLLERTSDFVVLPSSVNARS